MVYGMLCDVLCQFIQNGIAIATPPHATAAMAAGAPAAAAELFANIVAKSWWCFFAEISCPLIIHFLMSRSFGDRVAENKNLQGGLCEPQFTVIFRKHDPHDLSTPSFFFL